MFTKQKLYCRACGKEMFTTFNRWNGEVCGRRCSQELEWRRVLSILGKEYYADPTPLLCICGAIAAEGDYCEKCGSPKPMSDAEKVIKSWPKWKQDLAFPKPPKGHEWCKPCKGTGGVDVYEGCASVGYPCWVHCACSDCDGLGYVRSAG